VGQTYPSGAASKKTNGENQQRKSGQQRQPNKTESKLENGRNSDPMTPSQNGVKLTAQTR
jgi:hypothetical protein